MVLLFNQYTSIIYLLFQSVYYYKYIKNVKFEQLEDTPEIKIRNEIRKDIIVKLHLQGVTFISTLYLL